MTEENTEYWKSSLIIFLSESQIQSNTLVSIERDDQDSSEGSRRQIALSLSWAHFFWETIKILGKGHFSSWLLHNCITVLSNSEDPDKGFIFGKASHYAPSTTKPVTPLVGSICIRGHTVLFHSSCCISPSDAVLTSKWGRGALTQ